MANISIYIGNTTDVMSFCSYHEGHVNEHTSIIFECEEPIQGKFIQIYSGKDDDDTRPKILSLDEVSLQTAQYTGIYYQSGYLHSTVNSPKSSKWLFTFDCQLPPPLIWLFTVDCH